VVKETMMKTAVLYGKKDLRIERRKIPQPGINQVLIRVKAVGLCGSDIHFYEFGRIGDFVVTDPIILGHECSGLVVEVGRKVTRVSVGDQVVVEPGFPCGKCEFCRSGRYNVCRQVPFLGTPPTNGAFAEFIVAPQDFVFKFPAHLSFEEATLAEPLAVAVQAVKRGKVALGETAVVIGAGPIGLSILQTLVSTGISKVYITDLDDFRLRKAEKLGAAKVVNGQKKKLRDVLNKSGDTGVDVAFEAVGNYDTINEAIAVARPGGRVVLVGIPLKKEVSFNIYEILTKELDLVSVWRYLRAFPVALALLGAGRINTAEMITHRFLLDNIQQAFSLVAEKKENAIKVVVTL